MNKKHALYFIVVVLMFCIISWLGIGYNPSGSAVADLEEELCTIHGKPYTGRSVESGAENMQFSIKPDSFFLTNYNLRRFLGLDYRYKCTVTYTVYSKEELVSTRTITYIGIDPMGYDEEGRRAYIETDSIKD